MLMLYNNCISNIDKLFTNNLGGAFMKKSAVLLQPSNVHLEALEESFLFVKGYAIAKDMRNTLIALSVAKQLHSKQKRKGGEPYLIHPLEVASYLINLSIDDDVTCAAAILHDVVEDCNIKNAYNELAKKYDLDDEVIKVVLLLTKDENYKDGTKAEKTYYENIKKDKRALIIKLSDRANNLSTIDAFTKEKMIKYVSETRNLIFPLCKYGKAYYPELSGAITIIKYQMVSICETIESLYDIPADILTSPTNYRKTLLFIRGFAKGKNMPNTLKALALAERLHEGQFRKCGDPFIIHPLRVATYLISLKINDDIICAAALLHEVFKHCNIDRNGNELVDLYGLDADVPKLIRLVSKADDISYDEYYDGIRSDYRALLIKLSNRANTCTKLSILNETERKEYINENSNYIYPLCTYAKAYFPDFSDQIVNMKFHISSICRVVEAISASDK